ncbi:hypothetical protein ACUNV4_16220 [Granulosicoccus sp. 3-233]|uniref:hypothetical protein n=1 Tax=Granulosicoccus sp. 3-233 TaxID=3417969 RepID=UPI003D3597A1
MSNDFHETSASVLKDWVDLRDHFYEPTLSTLCSSLSPHKDLFEPADETAITGDRGYQPKFGVRDQTITGNGRCAGYALAALIDLQTRLQNPSRMDRCDCVSSDMLYWMGAYNELAIDNTETLSVSGRTNSVSGTGQQEGLRSLRSVIKGFYHYGVCPDFNEKMCIGSSEEMSSVPLGSWQSVCHRKPRADTPEDKEQRFPTYDQSVKAKEICLGAYFRLRPVLNHFHAALNEVGAILVTVQIHGGWNAPLKISAKGRIDSTSHDSRGLHAVVIIGYNNEGFLVLNSWGTQWGGYEIEGKSVAGVALWSYEDWSRNIVDAWVLRLGVSAPKAFSSSIGEQGWNRILMGQSLSVPCHELLGHYMHLDDGFHVSRGPYPSLPENWCQTRRHLEEKLGKSYDGVLLWIPGSLESIEEAFESATRIKDMAKSRRLFPYVVFWCSTFVDKSMELITTIFDSCADQAGADSVEMNALIEERLQGVGRAIWRDIEWSAARSVSGIKSSPHHDADTNGSRGHVASLVTTLLEMKRQTNTELHMVAEGAGALVVQELLRYQKESESEVSLPLACHLDTLSLSMPAIGLPRAEKFLLPLVKTMNANQPEAKACNVPVHDALTRQQLLDDSHDRNTTAPARIYVPSHELESRLFFGAYSGSILQLVSRAFEDRWLCEESAAELQVNPEDPGNPPRTFLGMSGALAELKESEASDDWSTAVPDHTLPHLERGWSEIDALSDPVFSRGRVPQFALFRDPSIIAEIFRSIDQHRKAR